MKSLLLILSAILLINTSVFGQESQQITSGIGYINSFHKQVGIEFTIEYEGKVFREWTGLYVQGRTAYLDNSFSNYKGNEILTDRFDLAIGVHQYFTPELSIWRPHFGFGTFVAFQDFEEKLTANSYRLTDEISVGLEWELVSMWVVDSFSWGFGYKGTYHKFDVFSERVRQYENHLTLFCSYSF